MVRRADNISPRSAATSNPRTEQAPASAESSEQPGTAPHRPSNADVLEVKGSAGTGPSTPGPEEVARKFYDAFIQGRVDDMEALYAEDVHFKDTIFEYRDRKGTMHMWRKLQGAKITYEFDRVEGDVAIGRWVARYKLIGRVENHIESRLTVRDGKIVEHIDDFSWSRWSKQALRLGPLAELGFVRSIVSAGLRALINR